MNFKFCIYLYFLLLFTGCGLRIGEVYKDAPLKEMALGCMNQLNEQLSGYLKQEIPEEEIGAFSRCLQSALIAFKNHVWGKHEKIYTPEELRSFIQEFFLTDQTISDELLHQLMILKTHFAGGRQDQLTNKEIDQIIEVIKIFENFMNSIYPYNRIFFTSARAQPEEAKKGLDNLREHLHDLIKKLFKHPYSLNGAYTFIQELTSLLTKNSEQKPNLSAVQILKPFSAFIFNTPTKNVIAVEEWDKLIDGLMELYSSFIYFQLAERHKKYFPRRALYYGLSLEQMLTFLENRIHSSYYDTVISAESLWVLAYNLYKEKVIPNQIQLSSLAQITQALFGKVIARVNHNKFQFSIGLNDLKWIRAEYDRWKAVQHQLDQAHKQMKTSNTPQPWHLAHFLGINNMSAQAKAHFQTLFDFRPLYNENIDEDLNVHLLYDKYLHRPGYKNLTINSTYWSLARAVQRGYAKRFSEYGLTREELADFLRDIAGVIIDLELTNSLGDPHAENFGRTEFIAANLITYATQGFYKDQWAVDENGKRVEVISQKEGMEYFSLTQLVFNTLNSLYTKMQELCSQEWISRSCFYSNILYAIQNSANHLPHLADYIRQMPSKEKAGYIDTMFKVAVINPEEIQTLNDITSIHLRNLAFALIYQEVMFTRFNFNSNDLLEEDEINSAFPLYQGLIQYIGEDVLCLDISEMEEKGTDRAIYNYIVLERRAPQLKNMSLIKQWSLNAYIGYLHIDNPPFLNFKLTRPQILELAFNLVQALTAKKDSFGKCPQ